MSKKGPVSARETYVLDDDQIEELDEASLTGVMRDVTGTIETLEFDDRDPLPDEIEWDSLLIKRNDE